MSLHTLPLCLLLALAGPVLLSGPALAQKEAAPVGVLGGRGKDPIKIDADRLDVFDRENKAVFAGNVVAVQGDATIRCSSLSVHYKRARKEEAPKEGEPQPEKTPASMAENGIQRVECAGPVTVVQKDQVATGDNAVFDQVAKRVVLTGNVVLSQCQNVTRGSRLVYDMGTGRANMDPGANGRVSAMFVPGEKAEAKGAKGCATPAIAGRPAAKPSADKPAAARAQAN